MNRVNQLFITLPTLSTKKKQHFFFCFYYGKNIRITFVTAYRQTGQFEIEDEHL